jgi:hypothetical protein
MVVVFNTQDPRFLNGFEEMHMRLRSHHRFERASPRTLDQTFGHAWRRCLFGNFLNSSRKKFPSLLCQYYESVPARVPRPRNILRSIVVHSEVPGSDSVAKRFHLYRFWFSRQDLLYRVLQRVPHYQTWNRNSQESVPQRKIRHLAQRSDRSGHLS